MLSGMCRMVAVYAIGITLLSYSFGRSRIPTADIDFIRKSFSNNCNDKAFERNNWLILETTYE